MYAYAYGRRLHLWYLVFYYIRMCMNCSSCAAKILCTRKKVRERMIERPLWNVTQVKRSETWYRSSHERIKNNDEQRGVGAVSDEALRRARFVRRAKEWYGKGSATLRNTVFRKYKYNSLLSATLQLKSLTIKISTDSRDGPIFASADRRWSRQLQVEQAY